MSQTQLFLLASAALVWSGLSPADRYTWWLETFPVILLLIWIAVRSVTNRRTASITPLSLSLIGIWAVILCIGGHYTYAEVPLFNWLKSVLDLSRNYYDRIGHLAQGFVPAILIREYLLRRTSLADDRLLFFLSCCFCLALSASYELLEWWVSVVTHLFTGEGATAFLGTQGDVWDTQWDMFCALIGSIIAQFLLRKRHSRQLEALAPLK